MPPFTPPLDRYPDSVRLNTRLHPTLQYRGFTRLLNGQADVHYCVGYEWSFYHEMGHAAAYILDIERPLGTLVMMQPGYQSIVTDNPFAAGAQALYCGDYDHALADYAADAIAYYIATPGELHPVIRQFLDRSFHKVRVHVDALQNESIPA